MTGSSDVSTPVTAFFGVTRSRRSFRRSKAAVSATDAWSVYTAHPPAYNRMHLPR